MLRAQILRSIDEWAEFFDKTLTERVESVWQAIGLCAFDAALTRLALTAHPRPTALIAGGELWERIGEAIR